MSEEPRPSEAEGPPANGRLQSWKEIAAYLERDVRTVQRWERQFGLPVYRNPWQKRSSVYSLRPELDSWLASTHVARTEADVVPPPRPIWLRRSAIAVVLAIGGLGLWLARGPASIRPSGVVAERVAGFRFTSGEASPDGRWFAYSDAERAFLRVKSLVTTRPDRLLVDRPVLNRPIWSPDSRQMAYVRAEGGVRRIEIVDLESRERRLVLQASFVQTPLLFGWVSAGNELVGRMLDGPGKPVPIVGVDIATGDVREIGRLSEGFPIAMSPDGRLVVFTRRGAQRPTRDLFLHDLETGEDIRLTDDPLEEHTPVWSRDSRFLVFVRGFSTDADRRLLGLEVEDGKPAGAVFDLGPAGDFHRAAGLSLSGRGDLFVGRRFEGFRAAVLDIDPETSKTVGSPRTDFPEGSDIAWWIDDRTVWLEDFTLSEEMPTQRLYVERDLFTGAERIVEGPGNAPADLFRESSRPGLAWRYQRSPNGRVVLRRRSDRPDAEPFVEVDAPILALTVSPDETTLALETYRASRQQFEVSVVDVATRRVTPLLHTRLDSKPMWSPDSREISVVDGPCLLVSNRDGSVVDEVTCAPAPPHLPTGRAPVVGLLDQLLWLDLNLASWSPDGTKLLFAVPVPAEERVELWAVDRRTGAHETLFAGDRGYGLIPRGPAWSPSGTRVSFSLRRHPPSEIWVVRDAIARLRDLTPVAN